MTEFMKRSALVMREYVSYGQLFVFFDNLLIEKNGRLLP